MRWRAPGLHAPPQADAAFVAQYHKQLTEAADRVRKEVGGADIAIVLGSGLNGFTRHLTEAKVRRAAPCRTSHAKKGVLRKGHAW
jgi:hypothetical protein